MNSVKSDLVRPLYTLGIARRLSGKESAYQRRWYGRHVFDPWVRKIPWRKKWQSTPVFLPGKSHRHRSLANYSPWAHRVGHNWACTCSLTLILYFRTHPRHYFSLHYKDFFVSLLFYIMEHIGGTLLSCGYLLRCFLHLSHFQRSKNLIEIQQWIQKASKKMFWIIMFTYLLLWVTWDWSNSLAVIWSKMVLVFYINSFWF